MNIIVLREHFESILSAVQSAANERASLSALKCVLLKAEGGKISASATNLEIAITASASAKVVEKGDVAVPVSTLTAVVSNIPHERLTLEQKENALILKTDSYEATLQGIPASEFPVIPSLAEEHLKFECDGAVLKEGIEQTVFAARVSDLHPELSGILFSGDGTALKLVATDRFRLAEKTVREVIIPSSVKHFRFIVPLKTKMLDRRDSAGDRRRTTRVDICRRCAGVDTYRG